MYSFNSVRCVNLNSHLLDILSCLQSGRNRADFLGGGEHAATPMLVGYVIHNPLPNDFRVSETLTVKTFELIVRKGNYFLPSLRQISSCESFQILLKKIRI